MAKSTRRFFLAAGLAASVLPLALPVAARGDPLTVAAAASLQGALREVQRSYRGAAGSELTLVFGASGSLARQIEQGAPYDVFASADAERVETLAREGLIAPDSVAAYAEGRLALAVGDAGLLQGLPPELDAAALAWLRAPDVRVIALANPALAPYGAAAVQTLRAAGLLESLRHRLVYGDNVRQALTYVETGNAEAGFVAASLLVAGGRPWRPIAATLHRPIRQVLGIRAGTPRQAEARAFVAFLRGAEGQRILARHGLRPPRNGPPPRDPAP